MTRRIRAHFDGNVIVPDEPLDLVVDQPLDVHVTPLASEKGRSGSELVDDNMKDLARLSESGMDFWQNDIDDQVWNDAVQST